jgi:hypothetical protein
MKKITIPNTSPKKCAEPEYPTFPETELPPFDVSHTLKSNGVSLNFNNTLKFLISPFGDFGGNFYVNIDPEMILSYRVLVSGKILDKKVIKYENIVSQFTKISKPRISGVTKIEIPSFLFCKLNANITTSNIELNINIKPEFTDQDFSSVQLFGEYQHYDKTNSQDKIEEVRNMETVFQNFTQHQYFSNIIPKQSTATQENQFTLPFINLVKGIIIKSNSRISNIRLVSFSGEQISTQSMITAHDYTYYIPTKIFINKGESIKLLFKSKSEVSLDIIALSENVLIYENGSYRLGYPSIYGTIVPV